MIRSLVLPGWGQLHNGSWIKATAVAAGEGTLGYRLIQDWKELDQRQAEVEAARQAGDADAELSAVNAYNDLQSSLVAREWLLAAVVLYAMVDAYVDAHFRNFDIEFKRDPALPQGARTPDPRAGVESRLSIRWTF